MIYFDVVPITNFSVFRWPINPLKTKDCQFNNFIMTTYSATSDSRVVKWIFFSAHILLGLLYCELPQWGYTTHKDTMIYIFITVLFHLIITPCSLQQRTLYQYFSALHSMTLFFNTEECCTPFINNDLHMLRCCISSYYICYDTVHP